MVRENKSIMDSKIIDDVKDSISKLESKKEDLIQKLNELDRLKDNEYVKRYLELIKYDNDTNRKYILKSSDDLIEDAWNINNYKIRDNNIYFCVGAYKYDTNCDIVHGIAGYKVNLNEEADYKIYRNIENEFDEKEISIAKCELFENTHTIIYPKSYYNANKEYYLLRKEFLKDCIVNQDKAVEKLLTKNVNHKMSSFV